MESKQLHKHADVLSSLDTIGNHREGGASWRTGWGDSEMVRKTAMNRDRRMLRFIGHQVEQK